MGPSRKLINTSKNMRKNAWISPPSSRLQIIIPFPYCSGEFLPPMISQMYKYDEHLKSTWHIILKLNEAERQRWSLKYITFNLTWTLFFTESMHVSLEVLLKQRHILYWECYSNQLPPIVSHVFLIRWPATTGDIQSSDIHKAIW